ncbi:dienelactone hydrolase family protein [Sphingobium xenophagum]|uniref:dienelactone hydrolase family protein n=1 Tax=Sphingobium xenophagum TaxID=121428 RepID=UPI0002E9E610|nr:dienelactone hydrolase family protein [Sphingobium xenophagum]
MAAYQVTLNSPTGGNFGAYLATPEAPNGCGVVVLQEIFGINANLRATADHWASQGYFAIVPDLFWRQQPGVELDPASEADRARATELMQGLDQPLAVKDALLAADYLRKLPEVTGDIAAIGYCLGGKLAYLLSMQAGIDAAISYYGVAIQSALGDMPDVKAALLLHLAEQDHLCPPEAQAAIEQAAAGNADRVSVLRHPGVGHAFARIGGATFNPDAAGRANAATLALLDRKLGTVA